MWVYEEEVEVRAAEWLGGGGLAWERAGALWRWEVGRGGTASRAHLARQEACRPATRARCQQPGQGSRWPHRCAQGRKLTDLINERHENPKYMPGGYPPGPWALQAPHRLVRSCIITPGPLPTTPCPLAGVDLGTNVIADPDLLSVVGPRPHKGLGG